MAMNDPSQLGAGGPSTGDLDGLLETLQNGVTNLSPETAVRMLQNWQAQLSVLPSPNAQIVAGDLAQLSAVLSSESGKEAGTNVGSLLVTLAGDIRGLIDESGDVPGLADKLTQLASILEAQGIALNDNGA